MVGRSVVVVVDVVDVVVDVVDVVVDVVPVVEVVVPVMVTVWNSLHPKEAGLLLTSPL